MSSFLGEKKCCAQRKLHLTAEKLSLCPRKLCNRLQRPMSKITAVGLYSPRHSAIVRVPMSHSTGGALLDTWHKLEAFFQSADTRGGIWSDYSPSVYPQEATSINIDVKYSCYPARSKGFRVFLVIGSSPKKAPAKSKSTIAVII
ncbi:hypothetical protein M404DRAFT_316033 [Pisolithus tinctorius Marx 270]|uniref:Uncharacterized protein n=1 Tax=Pisolithus tinctorius Marx 270 TaxID=870435 RepID=A0A0C3NJ86_PISTI|nr:hypothetical protein M404DRAFT_316033 [Pisolithus tinctorius Marx 270]